MTKQRTANTWRAVFFRADAGGVFDDSRGHGEADTTEPSGKRHPCLEQLAFDDYLFNTA
jgi:hypothetical protein